MFGRVWSLEAQEMMRKLKEEALSTVNPKDLEHEENKEILHEHGFIGIE